ncbi:hypothetical protein Syun_004036 [Stephania yunnanensis]|uniref:Uncharacterized protein n=1 Tax=Stephania yunnanensis TaxID=152371 RepID=A0AAP0Q260_9MAGN
MMFPKSVTMNALINLGSLWTRWKPLPLSVPKRIWLILLINLQFFIRFRPFLDVHLACNFLIYVFASTLKLSKQLEWLKCLLSSTSNEVMTTVLKDFETKL